MARKKSTETTEAESDAPERKPTISQRKIKQLLKDSGNAYKDSREIAGAIGNKIRAAVEHDGLYKKAFSVLVGMDRMTPEKLADFWETLNYYVEASGLADRAKSAPRLQLVAGQDVDGEEFGEAAE